MILFIQYKKELALPSENPAKQFVFVPSFIIIVVIVRVRDR